MSYTREQIEGIVGHLDRCRIHEDEQPHVAGLIRQLLAESDAADALALRTGEICMNFDRVHGYRSFEDQLEKAAAHRIDPWYRDQPPAALARAKSEQSAARGRKERQ